MENKATKKKTHTHTHTHTQLIKPVLFCVPWWHDKRVLYGKLHTFGGNIDNGKLRMVLVRYLHDPNWVLISLERTVIKLFLPTNLRVSPHSFGSGKEGVLVEEC